MKDLLMGALLVFMGGMILAVVCGAISRIIHDITFRVRWARGWRPKIYIPKLVEETVERLADLSLRDEMVNAREKFGFEMTAEDQAQYRVRVAGFIQAVIEEYTAVFAFNSCERNPTAAG